MPPAKAPKKTAAVDEAATDAFSPQSQLAKYLNRTKTDHFNLEKPVEKYVLSSGSLNLDSEGVMFAPGCARCCGGPNNGKTPFLLNIADTLLDDVPNSRVVWVLSEGRLSVQNEARIRHPFTYDPAEWAVGTIYIHKSNTFENVLDLMRDLVVNNPTQCRYGFFIDSVDNMILRDDIPKDFSESSKVAGGPLLTKRLFQKLGLAMRERGHWCFFISQRTTAIKLDPYAKTEVRQTEGSGGNALAHNADEVLEFLEQYEGGLILENPKERPDRLTNRALGHKCTIKIKKSSNEKRFTVVDIPIKHGVAKGNAIWKEREIVDQLLPLGLVTGAAWLTLSKVLIDELEGAGFADVPEKVNGYNKLVAFLEERQDITNYLFTKFKVMLAGTIGKTEEVAEDAAA